MRIIQCSSGEQQHRRQMSGCNCIEQKHGGVPQRLQTLRSGSEVQSPDVARQGPNRTPDHEFRTCKQSVLCRRATSYMRIIQ
jgi:hypothetical protein